MLKVNPVAKNNKRIRRTQRERSSTTKRLCKWANKSALVEHINRAKAVESATRCVYAICSCRLRIRHGGQGTIWVSGVVFNVLDKSQIVTRDAQQLIRQTVGQTVERG